MFRIQNPDPAFKWVPYRSGIGHKVLMAKLHNFSWKTIQHLKKTAIHLSKVLWRPSNYRRRLQPPNENIQNSETWNFFTVFFWCCVSFVPSWVRNRIHCPNWIRIQTGSGSESPKHWLKGYTQLNGSSFSRTVASKRLTKKHWRNRRESLSWNKGTVPYCTKGLSKMSNVNVSYIFQ